MPAMSSPRQLVTLTLLLLTPSWLTLVPDCPTGMAAAYTQAQLYQLVNGLFSNYRPEIRPTTNGEATLVYTSVYLLSIEGLDEKEQVLETSLIIKAEWEDDYLTWNASDFGDIVYFLYPQEYIWIPDLVIENSVETQKQMGYDELKVFIQNDGLVIWKPARIVRTSCDIDVTYYPFDTQTCKIIISTWMSTKDDIDIDPRADSNGLILDKLSESGTWELLSNKLTILPNEEGLTRIQFELKLKRLTTYYVLNTILPVVFLSLTAPLVFYLPADAGEKISMGISILLAYTVYLSIIAEQMPQTSLQISFMSVYLTMLLAITATGVILTTVVLHVHHKPESSPRGALVTSVTRRCRWWLGLTVCDQTEDRPGGETSSHTSLRVRSKGSVSPAETPPPAYRSRGNEEITWPKVAEMLDRLIFIVTAVIILGVTIGFLTALAVGE